MNVVRNLPTSWLVAAVGLALLLAAVWLWDAEDPAPATASVMPASARPHPAGAARPNAEAVPSAPPPQAAVPAPVKAAGLANGSTVPPGVTAEQWNALVAELQDHPQREAELERIARYLSFQDQVQRFEALRASPTAVAERTALARSLQHELPQHWAARELSAGEAEALQRVLLEVLEPDPARRVTALIAWRQQAAVKPADVVAEAAADAAATAAFASRQAAVIAAWNQQPGASRDPEQLETQLEALRQDAFGPK